MNNKLLIYIVSLLVLSQTSFALETIFDNWLYSGQTITAEGRTFTIYKGVSNKEIIADYDEGALFVKNNSCQQVSNVRLCLDNIEYYYTAHANRIKLRAISLAPDISITRTFSNDELEAKDEAIVTVTITNEGGLAQNLTYTDVFPEGIEVEAIDGIAETGKNTALWERRVLKTESATFSYKVIVKEVIDRSFVAKLTYFDGRTTKTVRSDSANIKSTPRLLQKFSLGTDNSLVGQKNNVTLNLTSRELLDSRIEVKIIGDPEIVFTKIPAMFKKTGENSYIANLEMKKIPENRSLNLSKAYYFEFEGTKTGTFSIKALVKYSTDEFSDRKLPELKGSIKFSEKGVKVRTNLDDFELEANQAKTLRIWLQNLNPDVSLRNILVKLDGGGLLDLEDVFIDKLDTHAHKKIIEKDFYAPDINSSEGYSIKADVSYDTEFESNFTSSFTFTETVNAIRDIVITQNIEKLALESGEETTVRITLENPRKTRIKNILVEDIVPDNFTVTGITKSLLTLDAGDKQTAFTYILKAPRTNKEAVYTLNTTATYSDDNAADKYKNPKGHEVSKASEVKIKPKKFELTTTRTVAKDIFLGDLFDVEYTIKNPSTDMRAENIELLLPLQPEFDLVGENRRISLGSLEPKEEVKITDKEKRRAKKKGTYSLEKTGVTYTNVFAEEFKVNVSATSVKVEDKPGTKASFVFLTKKTEEKANNTGFFEIVVAVTNSGSSIASVELEDDSVRKEFGILNGSTYSLTHLKKIETAGKYALKPATAIYKVDGKTFLTASNSPEIIIVNNPTVSIEKTAPETANSFENFKVVLKVKPLAEGVTNLTIKDEEELHYDALTEETTHEYVKSFNKEGIQTLPAATATYNYNGELYEVKSGSKKISIAERELITINKTVSVTEAKPNEKIEVSVKLKNTANDEIALTLTDEGETWAATLAPEEERIFSHKIGAKELEAATAVYTYKQEERTENSNIPEFSIIGEDAPEPENGKVIKEKNMVRRIIDLLIGIVTWKRS